MAAQLALDRTGGSTAPFSRALISLSTTKKGQMRRTQPFALSKNKEFTTNVSSKLRKSVSVND
jgi:hypothetical protein